MLSIEPAERQQGGGVGRADVADVGTRQRQPQDQQVLDAAVANRQHRRGQHEFVQHPRLGAVGDNPGRGSEGCSVAQGAFLSRTDDGQDASGEGVRTGAMLECDRRVLNPLQHPQVGGRERQVLRLAGGATGAQVAQRVFRSQCALAAVDLPIDQGTQVFISADRYAACEISVAAHTFELMTAAKNRVAIVGDDALKQLCCSHRIAQKSGETDSVQQAGLAQRQGQQVIDQPGPNASEARLGAEKAPPSVPGSSWDSSHRQDRRARCVFLSANTRSRRPDPRRWWCC